MAIFWRPQMSVGDRLIDTEHKYLFALVNCVELALREPREPVILRATLDQLVEYTREHFAHEQKLQQEIGFPLWAEHEAEHRALLEKVDQAYRHIIQSLDATQTAPAAAPKSEVAAVAAVTETGDEVEDDLRALLADDEPGETAPPAGPGDASGVDFDELVKLLRSWIVEHVIKEDLKMRPYFARWKGRNGG